MKFVVTGAAGFIGSHITKYLVKNSHQVTAIDNLARGSLDNLTDVKNDIDFQNKDISNLDELYSDDNEYGGHLSNKGNKLVASIINNVLTKKQI